MVNWEDGQPNPRYWVLRLIKDNFQPGDKLVDTKVTRWSAVDGQAFKTSDGRKLLLVNRRNRDAVVTLPEDITSFTVSVVGGTTGDDAPRTWQASGERR